MNQSRIESLLNEIKETDDILYQAKVIDLLIREGIRQKEIAEVLSLKPSYLSHIRRLNKLPELILDGYYNHSLSKSHLFALSRLPADDAIEVYEKVLSQNLSVHATEKLVREKIYNFKDEGEYISEKEKKKLLEKLSKKFPSASFRIRQSRSNSLLEIKIKGNLKKSSSALRKIISKLLS